MTPEQAVAREEIRYTMSVYNTSGDRGRLAELAEAFTEDGILEFSGRRHEGRAAIAAGLRPEHGGPETPPPASDAEQTFVRHNLTTSRIELTGDAEADAWTYFHVLTPIGLDHCGVYVDKYRKVGERWLIAHRRVKVDWRDPRSTMAPSGS